MPVRLDNRQKDFMRRLGEASIDGYGYVDIEPWRSIAVLETKEMIGAAYSLRSKKLIEITTEKPPTYQMTKNGREWYEGDLEKLKKLKHLGITELEDEILRDLCREELNDIGRHKLKYYSVFDKADEPEKTEAALSLERKQFVYINNHEIFDLKLAFNGVNYCRTL